MLLKAVNHLVSIKEWRKQPNKHLTPSSPDLIRKDRTNWVCSLEVSQEWQTDSIMVLQLSAARNISANMESADHQGFWGPWRGRWGKVGRRWSGLPSKFKQWWRKRKPQGHLVLQPPLQCDGHTIQEQVKSATGQGSEELLSGGKKTFLLPSSSLKILTPYVSSKRFNCM